MGEKKVARMVLKVDLQCEKCYRKVKRVLCKFPQIQDQIYDEKQNTVMIKVVCCSPEKIKQKIGYNGGDSIKSIEIVPPPKPKEPEKPKQPEKPKEPAKPKEPEKPKQPEKPKDPPKPKEPEKPKEKPPAPAPTPAPAPAPEKPKPIEPQPAPPSAPQPSTTTEPPPARAKAEPPKQDKPMVTFVDPLPKPAPGFPPLAYPNSVGMCSRECYEGRGEGPSDQLGYYGPPRCYCGYHGRPVYDSWGGGGGGGGGGDGYIVNKCDYFSEENPNAACRIM